MPSGRHWRSVLPGSITPADPTEADTVYLGAMKKDTWDSLGGMRTLPSRVAEDADFYYRLRKAGGKVLVDPAIATIYQPRETITDLWRQFYRYGLGKADMLYINGEFPSWRPLAPLALILGLAAGLVLLLWGDPRLLTVVLVAWLLALVIASRLSPLVLIATAVMHLSYGIGLLRGLLRSPRRVRDWVQRPNATPPDTGKRHRLLEPTDHATRLDEAGSGPGWG